MNKHPLQQWQLEMIQRQFRMWQGLKQLILDNKEEGIVALSVKTNFNLKWLKDNLETIKSL